MGKNQPGAEDRSAVLGGVADSRRLAQIMTYLRLVSEFWSSSFVHEENEPVRLPAYQPVFLQISHSNAGAGFYNCQLNGNIRNERLFSFRGKLVNRLDINYAEIFQPLVLDCKSHSFS